MVLDAPTHAHKYHREPDPVRRTDRRGAVVILDFDINHVENVFPFHGVRVRVRDS